MRLIAHRGHWWPRRGTQNHPSSVTSAFANSWGVEVDVHGSHGESLSLGHDHAQYEWSLPADNALWKDEPLFLHIKVPRQNNLWKVRRIYEILRAAGRWGQTYVFWSPDHVGPDKELIEMGAQYLLPVDSFESLQHCAQNTDAIESVKGLWLEQPEEDWVSAAVIEDVQRLRKDAWVVSPELHGRTVDLASVLAWQGADGICTDVPHLLSKILNTSDTEVHPKNAWWT